MDRANSQSISSIQGTIMRESFTVNNKALHSRMHNVQGLEHRTHIKRRQ